MKTILTTILFLGASVLLSAQSHRLKMRAHEYYSLEKFTSAAPYMDQLVKKTQKKNKWNIGLNEAAISYYKTGEYQKCFDVAEYCLRKGHKESELMFYLYDAALRLDKYSYAAIMLEEYLVKDIGNSTLNKERYSIEKSTADGKVEYGMNNSIVSSDNDFLWIVENEEFRGNYYSSLLDSLGVSKYNKKFYNSILVEHEGVKYFTQTKKSKSKEKYTVGIYLGRELNKLEAFPYNSLNHNLGNPTFDGDGIMYFASDMSGGYGGVDIWYSVKKEGKWGVPENYGAVNTPYDENWPFFDTITNKLYFSSNGRNGIGGMDVYGYSDKKGIIENIGNVNSKSDDFCFYRENGRTFSLSSDRSGSDSRYIAEGSVTSTKLNLIVNNDHNDVYLNENNNEIYIRNLNTGKSSRIYFENGQFESVLDENTSYVISGQVENHILESDLKFKTEYFENEEPVTKTLLFKQIEYDLKIKTISFLTKEELPFTKVLFTNMKDKTTIEFTTNDIGEENLKVLLDGDYAIFAQKKGYLDYYGHVYADKEEIVELDLELVEIKKDVVFKVENILYDVNKAELREESKPELDKLIGFLKVNDNIKVELSSHTDSRSSDKYNQVLSQKRAQSCVDYLIAGGLSSEKIIAVGYGESKPVNRCVDGVDCSEEEYQENRRTEVKILSVE